MIRINLLEHLPAPTERLQAMLNPGRSGGFISRRETVLGGLFLLLAFAILGTQLWLRQEPVEESQVESDAPASVWEPRISKGPGAVNPFARPHGETAAGSLDQPATPAPSAAQPDTAPPTARTPRRPEQPPASKETEAAPELKPAAPSLEGSEGLTAIRVTPLEDGVDIFVAIKGRPQVQSFRVEDPNRVVLDVPGAVLEAPREQHVQRVDSTWVTRVRVAQNDIEPPLVRLVIEVPQFPAVNSSVSDAGVAIRVRQP